MKALHVPQNPPHSKPFSFPSNAPNPSHLTYSTSLPRPTFPIPAQHATHSNLLTYRPASPATDLSSQVQYLVLVLTTSPTRGELTWQETLDPSRFSADGSTGPIPCHDVVGQIAAVHAPPSTQSTPKFEVGDVVFGLIDFDRDGAAADEVVAYENEIAKVPRIPDSTGGKAEELLATIPLAGLTAWQALFEYGGIDPPPRQDESGEGAARTKRILITGTSGAVGLLATQLAAAVRSERQRVHITAVCSSLHAAPMKRLGADIVACYDVGNEVEVAIEKQGPFDLFIDLTGGPLVTKILSLHTSGTSKLLKSDGRVVSVATFPSDTFFGSLGLGDADVNDLRARYRFFIVRPDAGQLEQIATLMQKGRLVGFVDEVYSLDRGKEALEACEAKGRKRLGKVVIRVAEDQHRQL